MFRFNMICSFVILLRFFAFMKIGLKNRSYAFVMLFICVFFRRTFFRGGNTKKMFYFFNETTWSFSRSTVKWKALPHPTWETQCYVNVSLMFLRVVFKRCGTTMLQIWIQLISWRVLLLKWICLKFLCNLQIKLVSSLQNKHGCSFLNKQQLRSSPHTTDGTFHFKEIWMFAFFWRARSLLSNSIRLLTNLLGPLTAFQQIFLKYFIKILFPFLHMMNVSYLLDLQFYSFLKHNRCPQKAKTRMHKPVRAAQQGPRKDMYLYYYVCCSVRNQITERRGCQENRGAWPTTFS